MRQKVFRLLLAVMTMLTIGNIQAAKKVHMLGDSTMQPYDENTTGTRGWGMYFGNFLTGGWTATNYAVGGRDSRGGYNELWQKAKNSVEPGDYVIIQFAHNDTKYDGMDNLEPTGVLHQYWRCHQCRRCQERRTWHDTFHHLQGMSETDCRCCEGEECHPHPDVSSLPL